MRNPLLANTAALTALGLAAAACASNADQSAMSGADRPAASATSPAAATTPASPLSAADYVSEAARGDMYEIQSSQLALSNASSAQVKQFAQTMVSDHTTTTSMLKQAIQGGAVAGATLPQSLDPRRAGMVTQLRALKGADFDREYLRQQLTAHEEALALHQGYAQDGGNGTLKGFAAQTAPRVAQHLQMVQSMQPAGG